ncbi:YhgE/Pip domain-containing protein [Actinomadura hibisca]|uniref:YhgE/Pip domain-containing protein n=1 Tax=Actinomadura hibisca TaxID=68565 RepID=UPI00082B2073|nr:YhgE/Pip domain-containing protein [Actinomadura hibisca]
MRAFRLAAYELLRFRSPMQIAGLLFLLLVPLLYGGIYLWSNWNPYSKISQVPVAVVNEDRPVTVEGRDIDAGADFVAELKKERLLGWRFTDAAEASDGLKDGRYYAIITVPADFSAKLTSGAAGTPEQAAMSIRLDDANNFLVGIMAGTIQSELERKISAAAVTAYFEAAFGKLDELHDGLADAAKGSAELRDGLGQAKDGSAQLVGGLGEAKQGTGALATGLGQAKKGSTQLVGGLNQARQGTGALATGLGQAKKGSTQLVGGLEQAQQGTGALATGLGQAKKGSSQLVGGLETADQGTGALAGGLRQLKNGTGQLAPGADRLAQGLHKLTTEAVPLADAASRSLPDLAALTVAASGDAAELTKLATEVAEHVAWLTGRIDDWLHGLADAHPDIAASPRYQRLQEAVRNLDGTVAQRLRELAAAYPEVARQPGYQEILQAAERLDATLHSKLNRLADRHPELLQDPVFQDILRLADLIADRTRRIAALAAGVNGSAQKIAADARTFQTHVPALQKKISSAETGLLALDAGGGQVAAGARQADAGTGRLLAGADALHAGSGKLLSGAQQLDSGNTRLLNGAQQLNAGSGKLLNGARQLDAGNTKLLGGAQQLNAGSGKLLNGARQLDAGNTKLLNGAQQLNAGSDQLLNGAQQLDSGNAQLLDGAKELASGLASAEKQVPTVGDQGDTAEKLANPVNVKTSNAHPAKTYGRGLAPFFIAIALWVFGIVAFLLLRPVSGRLLASQAGAATVAFAAWLPVLFMGLLGALLLFTVLTVGLGLDAVNVGGTLGLMALGVATFSAIVHLLRLTLGAVGDALALALLMLQLVSCGGLYPVETLPQPFRAIHDVVPMTYFVAPMRATISGGQTSHVVKDALILGGFLVAALALLVLAVHLQRRWSMRRLKPELEL